MIDHLIILDNDRMVHTTLSAQRSDYSIGLTCFCECCESWGEGVLWFCILCFFCVGGEGVGVGVSVTWVNVSSDKLQFWNINGKGARVWLYTSTFLCLCVFVFCVCLCFYVYMCSCFMCLCFFIYFMCLCFYVLCLYDFMCLCFYVFHILDIWMEEWGCGRGAFVVWYDFRISLEILSCSCRHLHQV